MHTFHDSTGQPWALSINIGTVKRVKTLLPEIDLLEISKGDPPLITRLATDVILLADVLCALCRPEAESRNVSDEKFAELLGGDGLANAITALFAELADFFQKLGRTENASIVRQAEKVVTTSIKLATEKVNSVNVEKLVTDQLGKSFTSVPESSESNLIPSLSVS